LSLNIKFKYEKELILQALAHYLKVQCSN